MPTLSAVLRELHESLSQVYDTDEAAAMAELVVEELSGESRQSIRLQKNDQVAPALLKQIASVKDRLILGEPLQYVLGRAWFMGHAYRVNSAVLIPRPETEELVDWITQTYAASAPKRILDIGTGSGCLAIELKHRFPQAEVWGIDISLGSLEVAKANAMAILPPDHACRFMQVDILHHELWRELGQFDLVVSNPPYITDAEKADMHTNVLKYEPPTALFVGNEDPLLFYRTIAQFGLEALVKGGLVFYEINAQFGQAMLQLMEGLGYSGLELRKDMQGKDRMLKAHR